MTIECFVLLLFIMTSQQGLNSRDRDIDNFIRQEKDNPNFKEMFKKIMEGGTSTKKVDNFLGGGEMVAQHDYQKDPQYMKNVMEIINTPGYDPESVKEAERQLRQMQLGLPRFPKA